MADAEETLALTFLIMPDRATHDLMFPVSSDLWAVKEGIERALSFPAKNIQLTFNGLPLLDDLTLKEFDLFPNFPDNQIVMEVRVYPREDQDKDKMPESFEVVVYSDNPDVPSKKILVTVQRPISRKLYLGGFRNKKTSVIYHHASSQTKNKPRKNWEGAPPMYSRETQTHNRKSRSVQLMRETGTQMARRGLYIDNNRDKVIVAGPYFTSEMLARLKLEKTIVLQCHWRKYKARIAAQNKRDAIAARATAIEAKQRAERAEQEHKHKAEIERRLHPRTSADFEVLYNELENWRFHETRRIKEGSGFSAEERQQQLAQLLHKEMKLLQTIDRLKLVADKKNKQVRVDKMLQLMADPKKWELRNGEIAEVHTPFTTRARELMELYNGLALKLPQRQRLDVLLHTKWSVKEFDCNLTREIVDLVDREADLIRRDRSDKSLEGLRKRLRNLFLQFIEMPEFNPEAARFQRVPRDIMKEPERRPIPPRLSSSAK